MADSGVEGKTLEFTPSWVVALVCFSIVLISLAVDKFLICVGQLLQKSRWKMLLDAFRKIREELMLLGFISLLLAVFQKRIEKICIPERLANVWLPCKKPGPSSTTGRTRGRSLLNEASASTDFCSEKGKVPLLTAEALHDLHIFIFVLATCHVILCVVKILLGYEKILQWNKSADQDQDVGNKSADQDHDVGNKSADQDQHVGILCVVKILRGFKKILQWNKLSDQDQDVGNKSADQDQHVGIFCVVKILRGFKKILQCNKSADQDQHVGNKSADQDQHVGNKSADQDQHVRNKSADQDQDVGSNNHNLQRKKQKHRGCLANLGKKSTGLGWMCSFLKQFYPSVTEFEYFALHLNFMAHDSPQPRKDFHNYIIDVVRTDFVKIVGISWYLWILAVIFLLVNVAGWHAYFWISFIPLTLLLIAGTILEHMITRLAEMVAEKHPKDGSPSEISDKKSAVKFPSHYLWFGSPQFVLHLIHFLLFQNSLELIFFFFVLFQYDFHSCIMGKAGFAISRIVIGAFVQVMCIYRTLPLYAIMKSQCRDEAENHPATNKSAENGSTHRSAGTTEQMEGGEVELETKADIEAPKIRERTSDTKNN